MTFGIAQIIYVSLLTVIGMTITVGAIEEPPSLEIQHKVRMLASLFLSCAVVATIFIITYSTAGIFF